MSTTYFMCKHGHLTTSTAWEGQPKPIIDWCPARVALGATCDARGRYLTDEEEAAFRLGGAQALREMLTGWEALSFDPRNVR